MKKVILWGTSVEYDLFYKLIEVEVLKGNIEVVAIILNEEDYLQKLDGIDVIKIEELLVREYDFIIDMNRDEREVVHRILELLRIPRDKVLPISLFDKVFFDLNRWIQVKESNISIISNNCWGGITYHSLGLKFTSPFINMWMENNDYLTMLENLEYYMSVKPHFVKEVYDEVLKHPYPIVGLDDIYIHFNHYNDFESAIEIWNRRKERLNYDNLLVEMIISRQQDLERFISLPFEYKVGFSYIPCEEENVVYFPFYENKYISNKYQNDTWRFVTRMAAYKYPDECKHYDVLKLLNHEKDYIRAVTV